MTISLYCGEEQATHSVVDARCCPSIPSRIRQAVVEHDETVQSCTSFDLVEELALRKDSAERALDAICC